jgi:hypothetical protein
MTGVAGAVGVALVCGWFVTGIRPRRLRVRSAAAAIAGKAAVAGETLLLAGATAAAVFLPVAAGSALARVTMERVLASTKAVR